MEDLKTIMQKIAELSDIEVAIEEKQQGESVKLEISGKDSALLIGKKGKTLEAVQWLLSAMVLRREGGPTGKRVYFDVEGYRKRHEDRLVQLANKVIDKVKRTGKEFELSPMSPRDRRVIHITVEPHAEMTSFSRGEKDERRVIVTLKENNTEEDGK